MVRPGENGKGRRSRETASAGGRSSAHANIPKRTGVGRRNELRLSTPTYRDEPQAETKPGG